MLWYVKFLIFIVVQNIKNIENVIEEKTVQIEASQNILNESQEIKITEAIDKLANDMENKFKTFVTMKKCLAGKYSYILNLTNKVKDMDSNFEVQNLKIMSLEKFKSNKCDFESSSKHGLKVHPTRKHTNITKEKYPRKCDLCEKKFLNHTEMKRHITSHSYKEAKFKL